MATKEVPAPSNIDDDRWKDAIVRTINSGTDLQLAGLDPERKGHTCFARIISGKIKSPITLQYAVCSSLCALEESRLPTQDAVNNSDNSDGASKSKSKLKSKSKITSVAADELLSIGAVWIISVDNDKARKKKNRSRRATLVDATLSFDNWKGIIIRIHFGAIRYMNVYRYDWGKKCALTSSGEGEESQSSKKGVIILEDLSIGFAIINKPAGAPVHGYVYNAVENVAHMFFKELLERNPRNVFNVSVPQRLDNDTSGVLVVATNSHFASYMSKLLEAKTSAHTQGRMRLNNTPLTVTKRYKCLVCLRSSDDVQRLMELANTGETVTHYLNSARTIPRIFKQIPDDDTKDGSWLECHLRIAAVGFDVSTSIVVLRGSTDATELAKKLWRDDDTSSDMFASPHYDAVTQVEIELLTGRTHQIRGQMSALGFPLVGDSLYGGGADNMIIALHCCQLSFPKPLIIDEKRDGRGKGRIRLHPSTSDLYTFRSDIAWWNKYIK